MVTDLAPVQFVQAPDGVHLAFTELGEGTPVLFVPGGPWHLIDVQRQVTAWRELNSRLAREVRLVMLDYRGLGLSGGAHRAVTPEGLVSDLEVLRRRLRIERWSVLAPNLAGPLGLTYAAEHPDRVQHLLLWCTTDMGADCGGVFQALHQAFAEDWSLFIETTSHVSLGWDSGGVAHEFAMAVKQHVPPDAFLFYEELLRGVNARHLVDRVQAPTLVVHRRNMDRMPVSMARDLAGRLPNGRLALLDGDSAAPFGDDSQRFADLVAGFLREFERGAAPARATFRPLQPISPRESEVLRLVAAGLTNEAIADRLVLTVGTVKTHLASIYRKLDAGNRTQALARAREAGILD